MSLNRNNCLSHDKWSVFMLLCDLHVTFMRSPCLIRDVRDRLMMGYHWALFLWENGPTNNKENNGLATSSSLLNTIWLMAVMLHVCFITWFMPCCSWVSMMAADVLVPIWHQDISSHHGGVGQLAHMRGNIMNAYHRNPMKVMPTILNLDAEKPW